MTADRLTDEIVAIIAEDEDTAHDGDDDCTICRQHKISLAREVLESRAEIERLRAENGALSAGVARNGTRWEAERALADRLAEALRYWEEAADPTDPDEGVIQAALALAAYEEARRDQ
jgi:hypothetical protein